VALTISAFAAFFSYFPAKKGGAIPPVDAFSRIF